ncbi:MAG TPA: NAD-dependent epimerase/dehydratase family protein [Negativicutes bacterium]|jgi:UDP-glucose 4-epimerase
MKVLVTGGAGFIGSHIVDRLLGENCAVVVVDNLSTGRSSNINPAARFIEMDIRNPQLLDMFTIEQFDYVIHLAAQTMVPKSLEAPDYDCQINILGTINVLEACRKTKIKRVIFSSTAATYGNTACIPVTEQVATEPTSFYGLSKLTVEKYLVLYHQIYGLDYVVLRYANVYGERQGDAGEGGVISIFIRKISNGQPITIFGDGGQTRDFVYAGDVANANYQALLTPGANAVYNISTQTETSVNTLVELIGKISGKAVEKVNSTPRDGDIYRSSLSNVLAKSTLSWQPQMALLDGLFKTYHFFKK